ncbi:Alpha-tubulin N-acetyltransferase 1 [Strongyloides ratti]|uniref:Alpha-tubulin N-acetyltransferase n=1 Tax=Strongyloides ratti TaxID=34506 RepID=A0A090LQZ0_STRRB|nr:Alpha-tubulin N-acetyltransferase 1 [Strongyloides ratti]CEF70021.1 Alpha-tubulin N-acetyltransferase 1 [Strongyloides ratti]
MLKDLLFKITSTVVSSLSKSLFEMEINYDLSEVFDNEIAVLPKNAIKKLNPKKFWGVERAINEMGILSMNAQGLRRVLTSYQKIIDTEEEQTLYVMWKKNPDNEKHSIVVGILKVGRKKLYLLDDKLQRYEVTPLCILDFYVHNTLQRKGNGHKIFEEMLKHENVSPIDLAIDKPSDSLLQFLKKYYNLENPVWQSTNFVVYKEFFEKNKPSSSNSNNNIYEGKRKISEKIPINPSISETASPRQRNQRYRHSQAGEIIHGSIEVPRKVEMDPNTPLGRKNTRDFSHTQIW